MSKEWSIPKRYLKLSLYSGTEDNQTEDKLLATAYIDANISFNTNASVYGMSAEANINIKGLTTEKMSYLATSFNAYNKDRQFNSLVIDAGYENNHSVIYTGTIIDATPNLDDANYSIDLKCMSNYNLLAKNIKSFSFKGKKSIKDICKEVAESVNFGFNYGAYQEVYLEDYQISDMTVYNIIRMLAKDSKLNIWIENNTIMVKDSDDGSKDSKFVIKSTDLIGSPRPDSQGCDIAIRMNSGIYAGMNVKLESKKFPMLSSNNYFIGSFYHTGETKGNKWQTVLRLVRRSIYEN